MSGTKCQTSQVISSSFTCSVQVMFLFDKPFHADVTIQKKKSRWYICFTILKRQAKKKKKKGASQRCLCTRMDVHALTGLKVGEHCASLDTREVMSHSTRYESVNLMNSIKAAGTRLDYTVWRAGTMPASSSDSKQRTVCTQLYLYLSIQQDMHKCFFAKRMSFVCF